MYSTIRPGDGTNSLYFFSISFTALSLNDIGKEFGDRDHTTVLHSLDQVEKKMRSDPAYAEKVKEITTNINNKK